ncbi:gluconate 2-dehydrogenase subunit 3 family protein [Fontimonas sp. SYSU GA230001]|uniref:gluconate 2-dehydrogenase subunit 3 family protein n=1 Tax=Fontimonas sp. SYSU GA230001 TaxID=3142450 RepID=UPI0032B3A4FB
MRRDEDEGPAPPLSRRAFLAQGAQFGGLAVAATLAGCGESTRISPSAGGDAEAALPAFAFTEAQRRALVATVARLIPAQNETDWSAADAGAVDYIEQLLNSFSVGGAPRIYAHGPTRARFAEFQPLSRIKAQGWMQEVLRLREVYAGGLDELNRLARGPLALVPGEFADLPPAAQDALLESLDLQNTPFFVAVFTHTMEGVYSHPVYGGNRDYVGWNTFCYEGDVHGRRFPNGHDPTTDDRPWDRFGGYSPEEMAQPGAACPGAPSPPAPKART